MSEPTDILSRAQLRKKGYTFAAFEIGCVFEHHWGRTLNEGDNSLFTTLTLHFNPLYFNVEFAKAHAHPNVVINPFLVINTVFGLCVEDLTEGSERGAMLGIDDMTFHLPVYPGDTLTARSTVVGRRESASNPENGIVTWHCQGFNQRDDRVIDFRRSNLMNTR